MPATSAAVSTSGGRFSAIEATTTPGTPVARLASAKAPRVGHQPESSRPVDGKSRTSIAASRGPSITAVKVVLSRSGSPQMKVW